MTRSGAAPLGNIADRRHRHTENRSSVVTGVVRVTTDRYQRQWGRRKPTDAALVVVVGGVIIGGGEAVHNSNDNVDSGKKVSHSVASRVCIPVQVARWAVAGHPPPGGGVPSVAVVVCKCVYTRENIPPQLLHRCRRRSYRTSALRYNINNNIMVRRAFDGFHPTTGYLFGTAILKSPSSTKQP